MMASAFLILVLAAVGGVVFLVVGKARRRNRSVAPRASSTGRMASTGQPGLDGELSRWVAAGLLTPAQSAAIRAHEQATAGVAVVLDHERAAPPRVSRSSREMSSIAEALGYLGGALALGGLVLLVSRYWPDLAVGSRLALTGAAAVLLLVGGALVRATGVSALARLRAVLWLTAVAATAMFVVVAVRDWAGVTTPKTVVLAVSGAVAIEDGLLWWGRSRPIQQLGFLGGGIVFVGAVVAEIAAPPGPSGIAVSATGALLVVAGRRRWIQAPVMTEGIGAIAMIVGAIMTTNRWLGPGLLLLTATAFALLTVALLPGLAPRQDDQLTLGIIGTGGLFLSVPQTLGFFSQDGAIATGLTTYAAGVGLLYIGNRRLTRLPVVIESAGATVVLAGAALTWNQWHGIAPSFGAATAVALIALGIVRDRLLLSIAGSVGLLFTVPWIIVWYFPGQGRAPLLTVVCGALILSLAVLLGHHERSRQNPASSTSSKAADTHTSPRS